MQLGKMSISFNQSHKSSISHNNRVNTHGNPDIDLDKLQENILYKAEPIEDKYHEIFDEAVQVYNQKQKRADRKIESYYEKIRDDSKTHEQRELVVAVGRKEDSPELIEHKKRILDMYAKDFEKRNPNLAVYNMIMHNDEANPHLHINYVPNFENKRGLGKRVGMDKALQQQGVEGSGKDLIKNWRETETDYIQKIAEATLPEFDRATVGSHKYMNVAEYKEFAQDLDFLKIEKEILERDVSEAKIELSEERRALDEEKSAFEVKRAEMDVFLLNKATLEQERDNLRAEREKEVAELERIRKTTNVVLVEDEIPDVPFKPVNQVGGEIEVAVNARDFHKMKEQAKKATSAHAMADYYKKDSAETYEKYSKALRKASTLEVEVMTVKEERDDWKEKFKSLQTNVNSLFTNIKEKVGSTYAKIFENGLTEVFADSEIKRSKRPKYSSDNLPADDLKETFQGHYDQNEVNNLVAKGTRPQQPEEKTLEQFRRRQEMDWS